MAKEISTQPVLISAPRMPISSPLTNPYYAPPFAGAYLAPAANLVSPSQMNTPPLLITQQTAENIQAEVNAPSGNALTTASTIGGVDLSKIPSWAWLTMAGFAVYLFMGKRKINVGFARAGGRKKRRRRK